MGTLAGSVAVVGAGVAGLACGRELAARGFAVTVYDKGRGPGGRTATRRAEPSLAFDHGAQFFTPHDPRFRAVTGEWLARGVVAEWPGRVVRRHGRAVTDEPPRPRYVGVPGMSAVAADLAAGLRVRPSTAVAAAARGPDGWTLTTTPGDTCPPFDALVLAVPAPQAADLLRDHPFAAAAAAVRMAPCWAVMAAFQGRVGVPWDGAYVADSPLGWVARNSSKPGRPAAGDCWVLHATAEWSAAHLESGPEAVSGPLLAAFADAAGEPLPPCHHLVAHRWRYSQPADPADPGVLFDPDARLAVCGDWLAGGGVEGAYLSGVRTAEVIGDRPALVARPLRPDTTVGHPTAEGT